MNCTKDNCCHSCEGVSVTKQPKRWTDVYPQGTTEGNEEQKAFIALARHPEYEWRSVAAISKESGLSKERVEEILQKYYKKSMVFQSPKNEDLWGYWERVPEMLQDNDASITEQDHEDRVDEAMQDTVTYTGPAGNSNSGMSFTGTTTTTNNIPIPVPQLLPNGPVQVTPIPLNSPSFIVPVTNIVFPQWFNTLFDTLTPDPC